MDYNKGTALSTGAADVVDAGLADLDMGELVTLPSLPDVADNAFEAACRVLMPNLSRATAAERYR